MTPSGIPIAAEMTEEGDLTDTRRGTEIEMEAEREMTGAESVPEIGTSKWIACLSANLIFSVIDSN